MAPAPWGTPTSISVSLSADGNTAIIEVLDNGEGMDCVGAAWVWTERKRLDQQVCRLAPAGPANQAFRVPFRRRYAIVGGP